ncbi:MAG: hypothetical protein K0S11_247 [Gammaproteobacteria bacterium]|jgi:hypothetical protein|nr:hypothetical protein [Gammaproteobacteria bacterium]
MRQKFIMGLFLGFFLNQALAASSCAMICPNDTDYTWSVHGYYGLPTKTTLGQVLESKYEATGAKLYAFEVGYRLADENPFRRLLGPLVHQIELVGNVAYINGGDNLRSFFELDPFVMFRWNKFPWNQYLMTSFGIGEGLSYASRIPAEEAKDAEQAGDPTKHLINFLTFELTAALPAYPQWQLVSRIHHRSGAFGTYGAGNSGSNALTLGIRYSFFS